MIRRYGVFRTCRCFFTPGLVRACWAAGWQAVADRDWRQWASAGHGEVCCMVVRTLARSGCHATIKMNRTHTQVDQHHARWAENAEVARPNGINGDGSEGDQR